MRVLREDCVPPVVCVRIWHGLYPRPQQLIPQQGGIRHSIWRMGGEARAVTETQMEERYCDNWDDSYGIQMSDLCLSLNWHPLLYGSDSGSDSSPADRKRKALM